MQAEIQLLEKNKEIGERNIELVAAKEKAEESDRLKSAFLANMSHEIRTPMNGILGFTSLLKDAQLSGESIESYIEIIEKSGKRMLNIINDIINISKVESGQMDVALTETSLTEQLEYIYTFFKPEATQKGIQLRYKNNFIFNDESIITDREKVYAILTNLVKNALKFTAIGFIEIGFELKDAFIEFYVKDSGLGIEDDQKSIIFERFRQGSESLTRNYEGAGLGLAISKAYVEMLGGNIWVESKFGVGSTFYFTIPHIEQKNNTTQSSQRDTAKSIDIKNEGLKIVIAEDDEISAILLTAMLHNHSRDILFAKTGYEVVDLCLSNKDVDLILMDIKMPEIDGYEATKRIRRFNRNVIIIAQTAFALAGEREMAIEAGCTDYISKPINQDLLNDLLKKYF